MRVTADEFKKYKNQRSGRLIYLYQILYDETGNQYLRYTNYGLEVVFLGNTFSPYVVRHDKIEDDMIGQLTSLTLTIGNADRVIQAINDNFSLNEKEVKIYTICEEDISNPAAYTEDTFSILDIMTTKESATLRLTNPFDVKDIRLPKRYFFRAYCRFRFTDENCQYSGVQSDCNKTLQRCRELGNTEHFGAFPSIPVQRLLVE